MNTVLKNEFDDVIMFGPKQLVSSTKLARNLSKVLDSAKKAPIFIERDQEVEAVLISIDDYRELLQKEERIEDLYLQAISLRREFERVSKESKYLNTDELLEAMGLNNE